MPTLFDQVTSEANVRLAVELTLHDASKEMFCNPIQIEHCRANQDEYVKLVRDRLLDYQNFETKVAFRSLKRKNAFVFRNFITPAIEDDIARMAVVVPIANALEAKLIRRCINDSSLMLNLIGLFALKSYNDNHPKEHMRISLQKGQQGNSIWEEHCLLIDKIPEVIQVVLTLNDIL